MSIDLQQPNHCSLTQAAYSVITRQSIVDEDIYQTHYISLMPDTSEEVDIWLSDEIFKAAHSGILNVRGFKTPAFEPRGESLERNLNARISTAIDPSKVTLMPEMAWRFAGPKGVVWKRNYVSSGNEEGDIVIWIALEVIVTEFQDVIHRRFKDNKRGLGKKADPHLRLFLEKLHQKLVDEGSALTVGGLRAFLRDCDRDNPYPNEEHKNCEGLYIGPSEKNDNVIDRLHYIDAMGKRHEISMRTIEGHIRKIKKPN